MARKTTTSSRPRGVALLMAGLMIGGTFIGTATAHKRPPGARHGHIFKVVKKRHFTKAQVNGRYYTKTQIDRDATGCRGSGSDDVMVKIGSVCIDRYESSIWTAPTGGTRITGAIPCAGNGQDCKGKIFARSVPGVPPRHSITWFQAQAALANSGKRLPSNAEWQMAAQGTPDSTACNVSGDSLANTGANAGCVSSWGANDMVGNLWEWVADWVPRSTCSGSWGTFSDDLQGLSCAATTGAPGALIRGGDWFAPAAGAGPFAVSANATPAFSFNHIGFRGAR